MRVREKEIIDRVEMEKILMKENVCHLGMSDDNTPYVLATNYGYRDGKFYLHSSREGRKIDVLNRNPKVCIAVDTDHQLMRVLEPTDCKSGIKFRSVISFGRAKFVENDEEKRKAMDIIMEHNFGTMAFNYDPQSVQMMAIIRVDVDAMTGKKAGYEI